MARFGPFSVKTASALHAAAYRVSRGRLGRRLAGHDVLLLTTTGRVTGRRHTVPLLYLRVGAEFAVIASYGGHPRHPDWYLNLVADPRAEARVDGARLPVVARDADPEEHVRLWPLAVAEYSGYAAYQSRTERLIPIVLLRRA